MDTIQSVFYQVANETKPVSFFIDILTKEEWEIPQDEKSAYQAFCCALLARNEKKLMQKGQYIKEYDLFIQKSFSINPDCIVGRLIRMMVEKKLEIVLIYKTSNPFDSILILFACLKAKKIPFIVETEDLEELTDLKYKYIICGSPQPKLEIMPVSLKTKSGILLYDVNNNDYYIGNDNDFIVVTSSKSTSTVSKKILLGFRETLSNIESNRQSLPIEKEDKTLVLLPFSYSYGLIAQFLTHLFVGADLVIAPKVIGVMQLKTILQKYQITNVFLTPLLARLILIYNNSPIENDLRFITLGGDKSSESTVNSIRNILNCRIYATYGLAEVGPRVATYEFDSSNKPIDIGRINKGINVTVVENKQYKELTNLNSIGYLKVHTPSVYLGYINGNQLRKPKSNKCLLTKDIVYHKDGKYYLLGRDNEYIIINSTLYWFQEFKNFIYNNPKVLKVKIEKDDKDKLHFTIFCKSKGNVTVDFENTLIVITCLIYSYFEEYGWRGYLQSELIELPILRRLTIITLIWFMWHLNFSINQSNAFFLIILFFGSWGIGQVAIKSKSIIACSCFHAVINIVSNMQMDLFKIIIVSICIISWFYIWYSERFSCN